LKRFKFRLESVLRVRRIQEDQARARLLTANVAAREAEQRVDARVSRYHAMDRPAGVQQEAEFERTWFHLDAAAGAIDVAREHHIEAVAHVAQRRSEWSDASMRVAALERLEERQRAEHAVERQREEDRLTDDLVVSRHARDRASDSAPNRAPDRWARGGPAPVPAGGRRHQPRSERFPLRSIQKGQSMTIAPIPPHTDITTRTSSAKDGQAPTGFAELLESAQAHEHADTERADAAASGEAGTTDGAEVTEGEETTETGDTGEIGETGETPAEETEPVVEDPATALLAAAVAVTETTPPDVSPATEVTGPVVDTGDVTAELAGEETAAGGVAVDVETPPTVPIAESMAAEQPEQPVATTASAKHPPPVDAAEHHAAPLPAPDGGADPATPPAASAPPPVDAPAPDPSVVPDTPIATPETRTDLAANVAAALTIVDGTAGASASAADTGTAPRVAAAPGETAATALAPTQQHIAPPVAHPSPNAAQSTPVATEVVRAPATPTPAAPQEQVVAVLQPIQQRPDGVYRLRLELHPAELGRVDIEVELRAGVLHANLRAEHATAAHALRDAIADLRSRLEAQGVRAGEVTVDGRGPGGGGNADRDRRAGSAGGSHARGGDHDPTDTSDRSPRPQPDASPTLLDLRM
jgi:flagellar export protein FliJ